jgi:putative membrane protein
VPMAALAQDTPPGSSPSDPSKSGETPHAGEGPKPSGLPKTSEPDTPRKEQPKLVEADLEVMAEYHHDNEMQVRLGNLASKRGSRPEVKAYGQMLVKDHTNFDKELKGLTKKTGQMIPALKPKAEADKAHLTHMKQREAEIAKLQGARFDGEYLNFMVEDHRALLAEIDDHIAAAQHSELAEVLKKAKPVLQQHHDRARELQQNEPRAVR